MNGQTESDISFVGQNTSSTSGKMRGQPDLLSAAGLPNQLQLPQALQNLQRILQSQLGNVNPMHLQRAIPKQQVRISNQFLIAYQYLMIPLSIVFANYNHFYLATTNGRCRKKTTRTAHATATGILILENFLR